MKFLICILIIAITLPSFAQSQSNERYNSIFVRQELLQKSYRQVYLDFTDINRKESMKSWYRLLLQDKHSKLIFKRSMQLTRQAIPGKDFRELLFYYMVTGEKNKASQVAGLYLLSVHTLLDNFVNNPQSKLWKPAVTQEIAENIQGITFKKIQKSQKCFSQYTKNLKRGFTLTNGTKMAFAVRKCISKNPVARTLVHSLMKLFVKEGFYGSPFPTSFVGHIAGNKIKLHNEVPVTPEVITNLGSQLNKLKTAVQPTLNKTYAEMTVEDFKTLMVTPGAATKAIFSKEEGFQDTKDHLSLQFSPGTKEHSMFGEVLNAIKQAKQSVFVDIFWMGGTLGMNLAKELMKKTNENPDFNVYIISDDENKFDYGTQIDIVTKYMRAYSEKFTDRNFYFAPANLNKKRTALPEFMDLLFTNDVVGEAQNNASLRPYLEKDGFHLLGKSDHTKTVVVDGLDPALGKAFVGSKNWTDASGGIAIDEIAEVQGPAVAIILNSFYYDTLEAFNKEVKDGGTMIKGHIAAKVKATGLSTHKAIQILLAGMDVIGRHNFSKPLSQTQVPYLKVGSSVIAPAQNNIDGTEMSAVEQNIQAILGAKKQIIVDDQFLWDPSIIEALKTARVKHGVDIFVMLNPMKGPDSTSDVAAHIPNNLFIPELAELGIPVKWTQFTGKKKDALLADKEKHGQLLSPEFHIKSLTIDGVLAKDMDSCQAGQGVVANETQPVLITGSANKDVLTMSGGFREYQVAAYDSVATAQHDCLFWQRWNDSSFTTEITDGLDFEIPEQGLELGITDKKEFLNMLRMMFFAPYNFTKDFFN